MGEEEKRRKRESFLKVFSGSDDGKIVLKELAKFARADSADFCEDARKDAYYQGRRSVVLEIRRIIEEDVE